MPLNAIVNPTNAILNPPPSAPWRDEVALTFYAPLEAWLEANPGVSSLTQFWSTCDDAAILGHVGLYYGLLGRRDLVRLGLACAEHVLPIYIAAFPRNTLVPKALATAARWCADPDDRAVRAAARAADKSMYRSIARGAGRAAKQACFAAVSAADAADYASNPQKAYLTEVAVTTSLAVAQWAAAHRGENDHDRHLPTAAEEPQVLNAAGTLERAWQLATFWDLFARLAEVSQGQIIAGLVDQIEAALPPDWCVADEPAYDGVAYLARAWQTRRSGASGINQKSGVAPTAIGAILALRQQIETL